MVHAEYLAPSDIWLIRFEGTVKLRDLRRVILTLQTTSRVDTYQLVHLESCVFTFSAVEMRTLEDQIAKGFAGMDWNIQSWVAVVAGGEPQGRAYAQTYRRLVRAPGYHVQVFERGSDAVRWLRLFQSRRTTPRT